MYKYPSLLCHNISVEIYFQDQLRYDMSTEDRKIIAKLLKRFYYSCFIMKHSGITVQKAKLLYDFPVRFTLFMYCLYCI